MLFILSIKYLLLYIKSIKPIGLKQKKNIFMIDVCKHLICFSSITHIKTTKIKVRNKKETKKSGVCVCVIEYRFQPISTLLLSNRNYLLIRKKAWSYKCICLFLCSVYYILFSFLLHILLLNLHLYVFLIM